MKKILITGANSYVGTNVEKWLMKEPDKYYVETLDMKDPNWKEFDFSKFDVVFHVAGIAHMKETLKIKNLYFQVNRDLAINTAIKAKNSNVPLFIFMSSMSVYGLNSGDINNQTTEKPRTFYGESKLLAEQGIKKLESPHFKIAILRPPIIYGPSSKGNFAKLLKMSKRLKIFPNYKNFRSMLFIDDLCKYTKVIIDKNLAGYFFPQNREYVSTKEIVKMIRKVYGKKTYLIPIFNFLIKLMIKLRVKIIEKLFGDLKYHKSMINKDIDIDNYNFEDSIRKSCN
jgi:UDP-glucose 4-epimerase